VDEHELLAELLAIDDDARRVVAAAAAYQRLVSAAYQAAEIRREALRAMRRSGLSWSEIGRRTGLRPATAEHLAATRRRSQPWWERLPADVVATAKRGPLGRPPAAVVPSAAVIDAIEQVFAARADRPAAERALTPTQLAPLVRKALGQDVSVPAVRRALRLGMDAGTFARSPGGHYSLTPAALRRRRRRKAARGR